MGCHVSSQYLDRGRGFTIRISIPLVYIVYGYGQPIVYSHGIGLAMWSLGSTRSNSTVHTSCC